MRYSTSIKWLFGSVFAAVACVAQVQQTNRFELSLSDGLPSFEVTSLQQDGLLLHRSMPQPQGFVYEVTRFDTAFQQKWQVALPLRQGFSISHKKKYASKFYLLSSSKNYLQFNLLAFDYNLGTYASWDIDNYIPFAPTEFEVTDKAAVIGGYYNRVPVVIVFTFETLSVKILPGLFSEIGELTQIKTYEDNTIDVLLSARYYNREKTIWMKSYTPDGDFINQTVLTTNGGKSLLFGRVLKTADNMKIIAGVFGNRNSEYSKGIFVASVNPWGEQQLRFYNFAELTNFFGYMKAKRERRVKDRIEKRKTKGKPTRFNYRLLVHELINYQNQFVLLGEVFYPKYKTIDRASIGFFTPGRTTYGNDLIFDGYRYTHATILGFDANGKLLWDNTFEINDVKTFNKEQFVKIKTGADRLSLLYLFNNQLRTKVISGEKVLESKAIEPLKTLGGYEVNTRSTTLNKLEYWYDDFLFAYGVQDVVRTNTLGIQSEAEVFFINKLKCQ